MCNVMELVDPDQLNPLAFSQDDKVGGGRGARNLSSRLGNHK